MPNEKHSPRVSFRLRKPVHDAMLKKLASTKQRITDYMVTLIERDLSRGGWWRSR